jgi:hypothetical protein
VCEKCQSKKVLKDAVQKIVEDIKAMSAEDLEKELDSVSNEGVFFNLLQYHNLAPVSNVLKNN